MHEDYKISPHDDTIELPVIAPGTPDYDAPAEPVPVFIPEAETEEVYDEVTLAESDRRNGRNLKIAAGVGVVFVAASVAYLFSASNETNSDVPQALKQTSAAPAATTASASGYPSPSPTPTSAEPSPTPSRTTQPPTSPSHVPSPSLTQSKKAVTSSTPPQPSPSQTTETQTPSGCVKNENAPGEIVCEQPVPAFTAPNGSEQAFEIIGGAAVDCSRIENGAVYVSINNASGWASLQQLGNPC